MKLDEVAGRTDRMLAHCRHCYAETQLDSVFFLLRRGDVEMSDLAKSIHCGKCGAKGVELTLTTTRC